MRPDWSMIPSHMQEPLKLYVENGIEPGGFMMSVLCNDLSGAVARADFVNRHHIPDIVNFLQWYAPSGCWGSPERVKNWMESRTMAPVKWGDVAWAFD